MYVPAMNPATLAFISLPPTAYDHIINPGNLVFMVPIGGSIAFFSFLMALVMVNAKRNEKKDDYKNETIQRIAASPDGGVSVLQYLREEKLEAAKKRWERIRLGGLILTVASPGLMVFMFFFNRAEHDPDHDYLFGLIPLLIGAAMLAYTYWLAPKE